MQKAVSLDSESYYRSGYRTLSSSPSEDDLYALSGDRVVFRSTHMSSTFEVVLRHFNLLLGRDLNRVLDFGCGKSLFGRRIAEIGRSTEVFLFDVSDDYRDFWGFTPVERTASFELPEEWKETFDVVTTLFSLEHVDNPIKELGSMVRLLKRRGLIYAVVPNPYGANIMDYLVVDHVQHFSGLSFRAMAKGLGLKVIFESHDLHDQASIFVLCQDNLEFKDVPPVVDHGMIFSMQDQFESYWAEWRLSLSRWAAERPADPVCLVGAGVIGTLGLNCLPRGQVSHFVDSNIHKQVKGWNGLPVLRPLLRGGAFRQTRFAVTLNPIMARSVGRSLISEGDLSDIWFPPLLPQSFEHAVRTM